MHGRVDPKTGKVDAWASPRGRGSYGITVTPTGEVWYASLAGDYIGMIDRQTGNVTVVDPPRKGAGPRRIWSDSKGILWSSFWHAGGVGRYDPVKKLWTHYPMPQSKSGTYSVYVDDKDRVWATDWMANAIQRFDPVSEPIKASRATSAAPTSARCSAVRARPGAASPGPTVWLSCVIERGSARHLPRVHHGRRGSRCRTAATQT